MLDEVDEVETWPELRVLADRRKGKAHFLILRSASPELLRRSWTMLAHAHGQLHHLLSLETEAAVLGMGAIISQL